MFKAGVVNVMVLFPCGLRFYGIIEDDQDKPHTIHSLQFLWFKVSVVQFGVIPDSQLRYSHENLGEIGHI